MLAIDLNKQWHILCFSSVTFIKNPHRNNEGSLGFAVVKARFGGVHGVFTPRTPPNLVVSTPIPKEP
jgi:hypothetical protein